MTEYANTAEYPFRSVAFITARFGPDWISGSGVLVGRNDVLTASHVVYDPTYGLADEVNVYFAYDPLAFNTSYSGVHFQYYESYDPDDDGFIWSGDGVTKTLGGAELDIALVTLSDPVGDTYGWMGTRFDFSSGYANVTGHPGAYSQQMTNDSAWAERDNVDHFIDISAFEVNPGNSGGPVWYDDGSGPFVVGLVSTGVAASSLSGHEWLTAAVAANDHYFSITSLDPVYGTSDNDLFSSAGSSGLFYGYEGFDTVSYVDERSLFSISRSADGSILIAKPGGGTDTLVSIENLRFSDRSYNLEMAAKAAAFPEETLNALIDLYVAYFNRVPEASGLSYWMDQFQAGQSLDQIAARFYDAGVVFSSVSGYSATMPLSDFVEVVYANVLDRFGADAPGPDEIDYWVGEVMSGDVSRQGMVKQMLSDARLFYEDADVGYVPELLDRKIEFGKLHAVTYGLDYPSQNEAIAETVGLAAAVSPDSITAAVQMVGLGPEHYLV